ncbi:hypothetical protein [Nocardia sp. CNY236]|uniref:hypothetical protein n=1 Tax=Nocardia sp. CNY236 TaxID=1169152 RepID=UPI0004230F22|nr:hypothetical protein [Nocardia sp. CNY236]
MTPEQETLLRDIQIQLRGPGLSGWPQLGTGADGRHRTLVEGLAAALARIGELEQQSMQLRTQVSELRVEISELEATTAELAEYIRRMDFQHWPWPLSLLAGPISLLGAQLSRLEALWSEFPGLPKPPGDGRCATIDNDRKATPEVLDPR